MCEGLKYMPEIMGSIHTFPFGTLTLLVPTTCIARIKRNLKEIIRLRTKVTYLPRRPLFVHL